MLSFIARKFIQTIFIIAGVVTAAFFLVRSIPGDPARVMLGQRADEQTVQALREQYGFNKPLIVQFGLYVQRLGKGDMGRSIGTRRPVIEVIYDSLYETAILASTSMLIGIVFGIALGVLASIRANTWVDTLIMGIAQFGISLPSIVMAALFMMIFGVVLNWLPIAGFIDRGWQYLILPAVSLGIRPLAIIARVTRSSMLDVIGQDFIRTARAKGLNERTVILRHALRNALNPVVTTVGSWFAGLLAGAYFIEAMFNIPGLGKQSFDALNSLDYPLIQGTILFSALVFVVINFFSDLLYAYLDPRIKIS